MAKRSSLRVSSDNFADAVAKTLEMFRDDVIEKVNMITENVANETVKDLKKTSPKRSNVVTLKNYASGWRKKLTGMSVFGTKVYTIYNANKPGLTHLLEKSHLIATRINGKYVSRGYLTEPQEHIAPAADKAAQRYVEEVNAIDF